MANIHASGGAMAIHCPRCNVYGRHRVIGLTDDVFLEPGATALLSARVGRDLAYRLRFRVCSHCAHEFSTTELDFAMTQGILSEMLSQKARADALEVDLQSLRAEHEAVIRHHDTIAGNAMNELAKIRNPDSARQALSLVTTPAERVTLGKH